MTTIIDNQLSNLQEAIAWVSTNLQGERRQQTYDNLVKNRIQLKKIKSALQEKPAIVLYGESQQGKSYLVSSLLSTNNSVFKVVDKDNDKDYDFITEINPIGQGAESTSVVTRFSVSAVSDIQGYPVKVKLLSITDILLILCDAYYNDIKDYTNQLKEIDIRKAVQNMKQRCEGRAVERNRIYVTEDDVLIMRDYFEQHFRSKAPYISDADYFRSVSQFIEHTDANDWCDIFAILWNNNRQFTELFKTIIQHYRQIQFAKELYTPYSAILREPAGAAILDVKRLHELNQLESARKITSVAIVGGKQMEYPIPASILCVLAAEVILQLPNTLSQEKTFLQNSDVLDFPGARARLDKKEEDIVDNTLIPQLLLRGKVAFLFNKYSDNLMINTLLLCHGKKQAGPRFMPYLLKDWIETFVGKDAVEREVFMQKAQIAPLFVIGTMFNLDLKKDQNDRPGDSTSLTARWQQRFETVYHKELFGEDCQWLEEWTPNTPFRNFYFLRDFYYSSPAEGNIFTGWNRNGGTEQELVLHPNYPDFYEELKKSFLNFPFVQRHFENPQKAWSEASSINKDGSAYIIQNLTTATQNINSAREDKFKRDIQNISHSIISELVKFYYDESSNNNILRAKQLAGETQAALDIAFGKDPYCFGKLMQCFILTEGDVYRIFHEEFLHVDLTTQKEIGQYVYIRMKAVGIDPNNTFETNLDILSRAYEMQADECREYFEKRGVDLNELFFTPDNGMKSISQTLAEHLEKYWFDTWLRKDKYNALKSLLDETTIANLLDMFHALYTKLGLTAFVAKSIRKYVDRFGANVDEIQEMIADMCAEILNKFVSNAGYSYLTDDAIQSLKDANVEQNLGLNFSLNTPALETITPANIAQIFEAMDDLDSIKNNLGENAKYVPGFESRKRWSELLKIGFVFVQDIPNYDVAANKQLGEIKAKFETINN